MLIYACTFILPEDGEKAEPFTHAAEADNLAHAAKLAYSYARRCNFTLIGVNLVKPGEAWPSRFLP